MSGIRPSEDFDALKAYVATADATPDHHRSCGVGSAIACARTLLADPGARYTDLGSDFYVYGHRAGDTGATVIVRAGREHPRPGEAIKIKIDTSRLHLFDAGTGLRIGE